jgi:hypothetical protein
MVDAVLICLAGGLLFTAALPKPHAEHRRWLVWLGSFAALAAGAGALTTLLAPRGAAPAFFLRIQSSLLALTVVVAVVHAGVSGLGWPRVGRLIAAAGFVVAVLTASNLLHHATLDREAAPPYLSKPMFVATQTLTCAAAAVVLGLPLGMAVFLLTCGVTPGKFAGVFRMLLRATLVAVMARATVSLGAAIGLATLAPPARPVDWPFALLRWTIGLAVVPLVLWFSSRKAATRWPAGVASCVTALCSLVAETLALVLAAETGLPF